MEILKTLRHEFKYVIPYGDMLKLRTELEKVLTLDRNGSYIVRSLYFDTVDDADYYAKQNGDIKRRKIRLRIYDIDSDFAKLEIKSKYDIHQLKESLVIKKSDALEIIKGNYDCLLLMDNDLAQRLYVYLRSGYRPKVIIEYDRIAYITTTTTRITFDYNIKKSDEFENFYTNNINYFDLTNPNDVVLEVKFDHFLEPYIGKILEKYVSRYQSVSKYVMGRNVE
ncbi:MAG: polyphosphate polymerase domain-containing protein [Bacilli bacterium]|nr:polyphosphate polymerase domain-containing protein [Bacilli bacterium]